MTMISSMNALPPIPPAGTGPIRAVLFDADGVLQIIGTPWRRALAEAGGEEFATRLLAEEGPTLEGRRRLLPFLEELAGQLGLKSTGRELLELWRRATPDAAARRLVTDLRAAGYLTVLATNQQWERREWMRAHLDYDGLCDIDAYSCTLGAAKPDPDYFLAALEMAGVGAGEALFVDDSAENIVAAAALTILPEKLRQFADYRMLLYAVVLIAVMLATNNAAVKGFLTRFNPFLRRAREEDEHAV